MKYEFDMYLARKDGYLEGLAEGEAKAETIGMRKTALRVIQKLTETGMPLKEAEEIAGMTLEEASLAETSPTDAGDA